MRGLSTAAGPFRQAVPARIKPVRVHVVVGSSPASGSRCAWRNTCRVRKRAPVEKRRSHAAFRGAPPVEGRPPESRNGRKVAVTTRVPIRDPGVAQSA